MAPTQKEAAMKLTITPSMTLKGHGNWIGCISYFSDGQRMISGSRDKTARQWDLEAGNLKEIEAARDDCEEVWAVAVSRDSRWIVTGGGDYERPELKASEVETGIVKKLQGHSEAINCIDISEDSTLLASGSFDKTARIWNLDTGKLVAGPFKSIDWVGAVRFSTDSKKLAVKSWAGKCLEVWDVQSQKLDERKGEYISNTGFSSAPIFWTNKNILASFNFNTEDDHANTIYEFDALTLETVGTPFKGHTKHVSGLALSFDGVLLASASRDHTIKLWAFESRQLLASFDVQHPITLILSPDSRTLAYSTYTGDDYKIYICNTPPNVLAQSSSITHKKPARTFSDPLNPDGTRRSVAGCRKRPIHIIPAVHPPPTIDPQQPSFRPSKRFRFSPRMDTLWPGRANQPRDPLNFPAKLTSPLSRPRANSPVRSSSDKGTQKTHGSQRKIAHTVDVPLGQATYADVVGVDDGERPYVLFFCLSWFQKKKKKEVPRPVYDDELEDDEEEENVRGPAKVPPPRALHEEIELTLAGHNQRQDSSRLAVADEHSEVQSS